MLKSQIVQILNNKSLIFTIAIIDLKLRYRSSVLGILWSFIEPLLMLTILLLVFSSILKTNVPNFPIFLLLGIIFYQMYSRATSMGIESLLSRGGIISSINVPHIIFPISSSFTALIMMAFEFTIFFAFLVVFQFIPSITILVLPFLVLLVFILSLGLAIPLSVVNVHYRDIRSIWTIILQATFFLTPIFYKLDFLPEIIRQYIQFSPLVQIVEMTHQVVLENKLPDPFWLSYTVIAVISVFIIGLLIHKKFDKDIVEKL